MQIFIRFSSEFLAGHLGWEISAATAQNMLRSDTHTHTQREREKERERERDRQNNAVVVCKSLPCNYLLC